MRVILDHEDDDLCARLSTARGEPVEAVVSTLERFDGYAEPGSPSAWDRYSFTHARVLVDKADGRIRRLVERKGRLGEAEAVASARFGLDAYINSCFRSLKNADRGKIAPARLDAAESLPYLLEFLFAVERRVRPFNAHLRWELETKPFETIPWAPGALLRRLERILESREPDEQRSLFRDVEVVAREHGHGDVVDSWEPDVAYLRGSP